MRQLRLAIIMFVITLAMLWGSQAYAGGYTSLGGAYYVNTYHNQMDFDVPLSDPKFHSVEYLSETALYNNLGVCLNNGQKFTYVPGSGQTDPIAYTRPLSVNAPVSTSDCHKTGSINDCPETATYYNKLSEVQALYPNNIPYACTASPYGALDAYNCYLYLLGLPLNYQCQNKNGILIELITTGVCARQTASKDDVPQATGYYRYTYPSFTQPSGTFFSSTMSSMDTCGKCVDGDLSGCLSSTP